MKGDCQVTLNRPRVVTRQTAPQVDERATTSARIYIKPGVPVVAIKQRTRLQFIRLRFSANYEANSWDYLATMVLSETLSPLALFG